MPSRGGKREGAGRPLSDPKNGKRVDKTYTATEAEHLKLRALLKALRLTPIL